MNDTNYTKFNDLEYDKYIAQGRIERSNIEINLNFVKKFDIKKDDKVLEIGCGIGTLTNRLYSEGFDILGIDISEKAIKFGKKVYGKSAPIKSLDFRKNNFKDNSFDVVLSFDVIEHIPNIKEHLTEVKRILKPNGRYIFQTPNILINPIWETIQHRDLSWRNYHISLQSYWSLKSHFKSNNFTIIILKENVSSTFLFLKVKKIFGGRLSNLIIKSINFLPLWFYPNFYAIAEVRK